MELYDISIERQQRIMKTMAAALGADVSDQESYSGGNSGSVVYDQYDLQSVPIGLGYENLTDNE